jgi:hypothetical protein
LSRVSRQLALAWSSQTAGRGAWLDDLGLIAAICALSPSS